MVQVSTNPFHSTTQTSLSERLWTQAYDHVRTEEPTLAENHEKILRMELQNDSSNDQEVGAEPSQVQMTQMVKAALRETDCHGCYL